MPKPYVLYEEIAAHVAKHGQNSIRPGFIVTPRSRDDLGRLMEALGGFHVGVELGVLEAGYSHMLLSTWPSAKKMYLVDLWAQQVNYVDHANKDTDTQLQTMRTAMDRMSSFGDKVVFLRNCSTCAAALVPDPVDFVFVDARHDYCGVADDLAAWWPKLRPGGILAGHDWIDAATVWPGQDWELCGNGTRHHGSVMGAVTEFAMRHGVHVGITWGDIANSWIIRKPGRGRLAAAAGSTFGR